ncbi:MAG: hypothetical protein FJ100_15290 [Deltaproteobacteria bacterium]|nr:hypothetical protein [Deltaproteobacteria bacterium]
MTDVLEPYNRCGSCRYFTPTHTDRNGRTQGDCSGRPNRPTVQSHEFGCPEYHVRRDRVVPGSPIPDDADLSPRQREAARRIEATRAAQVSSRHQTERLRMVRVDEDDEAKKAAFDSQPVEVAQDLGTLTRRELRAALTDVLDDALDRAMGQSPTPMHPRYKGGKLVVVPGNPDLQSKELEVDVLFRKVVSIRDKLRLLEQKVNASSLGELEKVQIQQYITGCYGSLTSFNYLFRDKDDQFVGESSKG